jgi:hypothetical protein
MPGGRTKLRLTFWMAAEHLRRYVASKNRHLSWPLSVAKEAALWMPNPISHWAIS